jgi:FlaA1/EpsC-like NDP-sugar epimerase
MYTIHTVDLEKLSASCVNRPNGNLFALRPEQHLKFTGICQGSSLLITGAAGFIAQSTLPHVLATGPKRIYLLDSSENGLAALARKLVATRRQGHPTEIYMVLADVTSPLIRRAIREMGDLDLVLHFAAVKHVRTERDTASALRILDVNVRGTKLLLEALGEMDSPPQVFAVSTDKAARPTSMMGASKLIMESMLWAYTGHCTSARFANVLFSSGSITESWLDRIARSEPLSAPLDTYRYFVTPEESGLICANAVTAVDRSIVIPDTPLVQPISLIDLARNFLAFHGKTPVSISMETWNQDPTITSPTNYAQDEYPLVCTPRDTTGEKKQEEFLQSEETLVSWTEDLGLIRNNESVVVEPLLSQISYWIDHSDSKVNVNELRKEIAAIVPGFQVVAPSASLDSRI